MQLLFISIQLSFQSVARCIQMRFLNKGCQCNIVKTRPEEHFLSKQQFYFNSFQLLLDFLKNTVQLNDINTYY